jgi:hypothetical protein
MRYFILFAIALFGIQANAQSNKKKANAKLKFPQNKYFKIDSVVINRLYPGIYGAAIINNITLYAVTKINCGTVKSKVNLKLDSFWMGNRGGQFDLVTYKNMDPLKKGSYFRGMGHLEIPTRDEGIPQVNGVTIPNEVPTKSPINYKGDMLIRFICNGKKQYIVIPKLQEGQSVFAP